MRRRHGQRARLGGVLLAALGALALLALPGLAAAKDRNHDRIPDRWEKRHHLSLKVKQTRRDQDRDHLRNRAEFLAGNNPRDSDSDDDGVMDGDENAGTIASFDAAAGGSSSTCSAATRSRASSPTTPGSSARTTSDRHRGLRVRRRRGRLGPERRLGGPAATTPGERPGRRATTTRRRSAGSERPGRPRTTRATTTTRNCTTADLVAGAVVEEAELELGNGDATFEEVELALRLSYLASSQSWPTPMSTSSGGSSW